MSNDYRMPRGWMNHPAFGGQREVFCRRAAFAWLVEEARYIDQEKPDGLGQTCLKRAQVGHSLRFMAKAWGWDDSKVRRFLKKLQDAKLIECVIDAGQTVVTICNYSVFSPNGRVSDAPSDAAATQQRRSSDANLKEGKKEERKEDLPPNPPLGGAGDLFSEGSGAPAKSETKRQKRVITEPRKFSAEIEEALARFRAAFPKRNNPHTWSGDNGARVKFGVYVESGVDPEIMISGATKYAASMAAVGKIGTEGVCDALTWLNQHRWENWIGEPDTPQHNPNNITQFPGRSDNQPRKPRIAGMMG